MSYKMIIVESPEKARTFQKNLGKDWKVVASKGHIRDLPEKEYGIHKEGDNYTGDFVVKDDAKETVKMLKDVAKDASEIYIATDADREGEKIAYDIVETLQLKNYYRITFSEVTAEAIQNAIKNPRKIDAKQIASQKARRLIDRIDGYPGTAAIKQDFKNQNLPYEVGSIGRSIGPSLRLLCQVEEAIEDYENNPPLPSKLIRVKIEKDNIVFVAEYDKEYFEGEYTALDMDINMIRSSKIQVTNFEPKSMQVQPLKPLTTASFQFGCFYLFNLRETECMKYAQTLFQLEQISYHRTDSCRVPLGKALEIRKIVEKEYGEEYLADAPRLYEDEKSENTQDAHPAIMPSSFELSHHPQFIKELWAKDPFYKKLLSDENYWKIYQFIFLRAVASQMASARVASSKAYFKIAGMSLIAKEHFVTFDGWKKLSSIIVEESDADGGYQKDDVKLPELIIGEILKPHSVYSINTPHRRPQRYGVGRFALTLYKMGLVRPSTMHLVSKKLEDMNYAQVEAKMLVPTKLGKKVDTWISLELPEINNLDLAAEFDSKVEACQTEEDADKLIAYYDELLSDLLSRKGINYGKGGASDSQVEYAKRLAKESGVILDEKTLSNATEVGKFIEQCLRALSVGKCPACKKGLVLEREKTYACNNRQMNCKFMIAKSGIIRFFDYYSKPCDDEFIKNIIKNALSETPVELTLNSPKSTQGPFQAKIIIEYKNSYWNLGTKYVNKKK